MTARQSDGPESGSGSVLAIALIGALTTTALAAMTALGALVVRQEALNAADAAALAAADVASGLVAGEVCEAAARAASSNGGTIASCVVDSLEVTVEVVVPWGGGVVTARSRAGPAPVDPR